MLKPERHQFILDKLRRNRKVLSTQLSEELSVSEDTIRRDLKELEAKNLLFKVHGGALALDNKVKTYEERKVADIDKKNTIAKKAVDLIHDDQVILMSGSTTNLALAKIIPSHIKATVFTYSLPIALELTHHPTIEVVFIGGKLNKTAQVTVGIDVVNAITKVRADICFMGVSGLNLERGMTEPDWEVAHIKKSMIEASDYVVALCTSTKLMQDKSYVVVPVNKIDTIITDHSPNESLFSSFKEAGINVM